MSGPQALLYISGNTNYHAFGPGFWFMDPAHSLVINSATACPANWLEALDGGNITPFRLCLYGAASYEADGAVDPTVNFKHILDGLKALDCKPFKPTKEIKLGYAAGVPPLNKGDIKPPASIPVASGTA
jgi:hypothetical protein